jgi:flagellar biogenesis protein FliO
VTIVTLIAADAVPGPSISGELFDYLKLLATFAAVVAFAVLVLRVWASRLAAGSATHSGPLQVAWRLSLEPRKTLYILRAGTGYLLLAASEAGVQLLTQLNAAEIEGAIQSRSASGSQVSTFAGIRRTLWRSHDDGRVK